MCVKCPIVVYMFPATDVKEFPDMSPDGVSAPVVEKVHIRHSCFIG